ncbi:MAG: hypothetical protein JW909_12405 [Planctomycetes bacterium]|nr:hypothetical protein [Planctomycetota bacterium]
MRFLLAGAATFLDVFAGAVVFGLSPAGMPWPRMVIVALSAFLVMSGGVLLGECFATARGYPSPYGAAPPGRLKTMFVAAGILLVAGVLIAGSAGRRAVFPVAGSAFILLLSGGVLQRTDVLEGLALGITRGLMVLAGVLAYPEAIYRLTSMSTYELPLLVASAAFLVTLLGRALEPEPRQAGGAAVLAGISLLAVLGAAAWTTRNGLVAAAVWIGLLVVVVEQLVVLWPAGIGKRRRIIRSLALSLPLGVEAAFVVSVAREWLAGGIVMTILAAAYFLVLSVESAPTWKTSTYP